MEYNRRGEELPDGTPVALPVGFTRPPTLDELVARLVLDPNVVADLKRAGIESEEEANDFDVPDELPDPTTPYQDPDSVITDSDEMRNGFRARKDVASILKKAYAEAQANKKLEPPLPPQEVKDEKGQV